MGKCQWRIERERMGDMFNHICMDNSFTGIIYKCWFCLLHSGHKNLKAKATVTKDGIVSVK